MKIEIHVPTANQILGNFQRFGQKVFLRKNWLLNVSNSFLSGVRVDPSHTCFPVADLSRGKQVPPMVLILSFWHIWRKFAQHFREPAETLLPGILGQPVVFFFFFFFLFFFFFFFFFFFAILSFNFVIDPIFGLFVCCEERRNTRSCCFLCCRIDKMNEWIN